MTFAELPAALRASASSETGQRGNPMGKQSDHTPPRRVERGEVDVRHDAPGIAVVTMRGEHDLSTTPEVADALAAAAAHSSVIVDLSGCSFIDSTIIKELMKWHRIVGANDDSFAVVIPPTQGQVRRVAELARLGDHFELHASESSALAAIARAQP